MITVVGKIIKAETRPLGSHIVMFCMYQVLSLSGRPTTLARNKKN